jgi:hypothetical protein
MISYSVWLEAREQRLDDYLDIVLNALNLDPKRGASTPLSSLNRRNLIEKIGSLEAFQKLSTRRKDSVKSIVSGEYGTVLDVIKAMVGYE